MEVPEHYLHHILSAEEVRESSLDSRAGSWRSRSHFLKERHVPKRREGIDDLFIRQVAGSTEDRGPGG